MCAPLLTRATARPRTGSCQLQQRAGALRSDGCSMPRRRPPNRCWEIPVVTSACDQQCSRWCVAATCQNPLFVLSRCLPAYLRVPACVSFDPPARTAPARHRQFPAVGVRRDARAGDCTAPASPERRLRTFVSSCAMRAGARAASQGRPFAPSGCEIRSDQGKICSEPLGGEADFLETLLSVCLRVRLTNR